MRSQLIDRLVQAMIGPDVELLESLLDDRLQWVHGSGVVDTKRGMLDRLAKGEQTFNRMKASDIDVIDNAAFVIVRGIVDIDTVRNGNRATAHSRFLTAWQQDTGGARLLAWQTTRLS